MKGTKIFGMVLAVAVISFVFASVASAQTSANILDGQWFKIKLGLKGYRVVTGTDTVLGKGSGSATAYLHFAYSSGPNRYTVTTCTQNDLNPTTYTFNHTGTVILLDDIYGETYPQVWDFGGNPLVFNNGSGEFRAYPTFYTKITTTGGALKSASISNVACSLYADLTDDDDDADYAIGSCSISGPLAAVTKVPGACRP
jgi:hypothetical protein